MNFVKSGKLNFILGIWVLILLIISSEINPPLDIILLIIANIFLITGFIISYRYHRCPHCNAWLNANMQDTFDFSTCPKCGKELE